MVWSTHNSCVPVSGCHCCLFVPCVPILHDSPCHSLVLGDCKLVVHFGKGAPFNSLIHYADWGAFKQYWWVCTARGLVSEAVLIFASSNVEKYLPSPRAQQAAPSCLISPVSEGQEGEPWPWIRGPLGQYFPSSFPYCSWLCALLPESGKWSAEQWCGQKAKGKWASARKKNQETNIVRGVKGKRALPTVETGILQWERQVSESEKTVRPKSLHTFTGHHVRVSPAQVLDTGSLCSSV